MANGRPPGDEPPARLPGRQEPVYRPASRPQPNAPTGRGLNVELSPRYIRIVPGEVETASVTVRNAGSIVDEVALSIRGDAATWARIAPDTLNIYPGTEAQATIRFAPPRGPRPVAGLFELDLSVESHSQPEASMVYRGSVEVAPYDNVSATAEGTTYLSGQAEGILPIKVRNVGNRPANVYVTAADLPGVSVAVSTPGFALQPGAEATVWANIRPRAAPVPGTSRQHPFTISVSSDYTPPVTIDGRFEEVAAAAAAPRRRRIWPLALVGGGLLLAGVAAVAIYAAGLLPGTGPGATPTATLIGNQPSPTTAATSGQGGGQPTATPKKKKTPTPAAASTPPTTVETPTPTPSASLPAAWTDIATETVWTLDTYSIVLSQGDPGLSGTLSVDAANGRGYWFFYRRGDGGALLVCEGLADPVNNQLSADSTWQWLFPGENVAEYTNQMCGIDQVASVTQPFAVTTSGQPRTPDSRITMTNAASGASFSWRPEATTSAFCALEGETCNFHGLATVAFGANGNFTEKDFTNAAYCDASQFLDGVPTYDNGDPAVGTKKFCQFRPKPTAAP